MDESSDFRQTVSGGLNRRRSLGATLTTPGVKTAGVLHASGVRKSSRSASKSAKTNAERGSLRCRSHSLCPRRCSFRRTYSLSVRKRLHNAAWGDLVEIFSHVAGQVLVAHEVGHARQRWYQVVQIFAGDLPVSQ